MSLAATTFEQVLVILIIIVIGVICYKIKLINEDTNKKINNIILTLVMPMVIIVSYQREFSVELLNGLLVSFLLAFITHLISIAISCFLFRKNKRVISRENNKIVAKIDDNPNYNLERFASTYSNCIFMGIPLINGIFGSEGVFYVTAYITIWNIFAWTHGILIMEGNEKKGGFDFRSLLEKLTSPMIISIIIGLTLFLFQIKLPTTIGTAMNYIASLNTPLAMLIAGGTIAQTNLMDTLKKPRLYFISFVRLLFIPLILLLIFSRFQINNMVLITSIIAAACPTAATAVMFAIRYDKNPIYAAEIFAITTILSGFSLPLIIIIAERLLT